MTEEQTRIKKALDIAFNYGQVEGAHHKAWVIDQIVRALTGCAMESTGEDSKEYAKFIREYCGDDTEYEWDTGLPC